MFWLPLVCVTSSFAFVKASLNCGKDINFCTTVTCATWSYAGLTGPSAWGSISGYELCGNGSRQSPINIDTSSAVHRHTKKIRFSHDYRKKIYGQYYNDAQTAKFTPTAGYELYMSGGPYAENVYQLAEFHFHWGCDDHEGSEHTIDGERFSHEMHLVHFKAEYGNFSNAATMPDGLAFLAILFKADGSNHEYDALKYGTDTLQCVRQPESTFSGHIDIGDFLKTIGTDRYYSYLGSLTTPGCQESVVWTVFPRIITINNDQLENFRRLKDCNCNYLCNNYRPTQPIGSRTVYYSH